MTKKKINVVFVLPNLGIGGVEKSLIPLLKELSSHEELKLSLLLFKKSGSMLPLVPEKVNVIELPGGNQIDKLREKVADTLSRMGFRGLFKVLKKFYHLFGSRSNALIKSERYQFDVAIAYKDGATTWFTAKKIIARKKIAFIHTDFSLAGYQLKSEEKIYSCFDNIYFVSKQAMSNFLSLFPQYYDRSFVFYNMIDCDELKRLGDEGITFPDDFHGKRILTIGRLSYEKGLDKAVRILGKLREKGYEVRWYVIGKGREVENLKKLARSLGVENDFLLLGEMENPYRMLSDCDIYVQPSEYEGYSISLAEARCFCKPIVASDFAGANEQLTHMQTGIVTGKDEESILSGIELLLNNEDLRNDFVSSLKNEKSADYHIQINKLCQNLGYFKEIDG